MTMRRYPSAIVGLGYPNRNGVLCHVVATLLSSGDTVELRREPDNRFDTEAVAVYVRGEPPLHVGYVPARHRWIGEQIDSGRGITATVGDILNDRRGRIAAVDLDVDLERAA